MLARGGIELRRAGEAAAVELADEEFAFPWSGEAGDGDGHAGRAGFFIVQPDDVSEEEDRTTAETQSGVGLIFPLCAVEGDLDGDGGSRGDGAIEFELDATLAEVVGVSLMFEGRLVKRAHADGRVHGSDGVASKAAAIEWNGHGRTLYFERPLFGCRCDLDVACRCTFQTSDPEQLSDTQEAVFRIQGVGRCAR